MADDARQRAMAGAWLAFMGHTEPLWPMLRMQNDASVRYALIDRLQSLQVSADHVSERMRTLLTHLPAADDSLTTEMAASPGWK